MGVPGATGIHHWGSAPPKGLKTTDTDNKLDMYSTKSRMKFS